MDTVWLAVSLNIQPFRRHRLIYSGGYSTEKLELYIKPGNNSLSGTFRSPRATFIGRAPGPAALIAAAARPSSAAIPIIIIAGETARGMTLLGLHLVRGLMGKKSYQSVRLQQSALNILLVILRNAKRSYFCGLPAQTGSRSDVHKPIYGPSCEEHLLHRGHPQTCCTVKVFFFFEIGKAGTEGCTHAQQLQRKSL